MPKIKPVMAWGYVRKNVLQGNCFATRAEAVGYRFEDETVVRVRISVVPKAKRKVKK